MGMGRRTRKSDGGFVRSGDQVASLKTLDYESESPVILAVDTSYIAVGYFLCQCMEEDER